MHDANPTYCLVCGRLLTDPESVERGIGPECSGQGYPLDDSPEKQRVRSLVRSAAVACDKGQIESVREKMKEVAELGFPAFAAKALHRFENAERKAKILITADEQFMYVNTPFRRGRKNEFITAMRQIPGRWFDYGNKLNRFPLSSKPHVWALLCEFFPGEFGTGPKGIFRIPQKEKVSTANLFGRK